MTEELLEKWGVKPTSNRLLVAKALSEADAPISLIELETQLETLDRSSISRVLSLLRDKGMVHEMEDGRGITKYELCRSSHSLSEGCSVASHNDLHPHFFCEKCEKVYCFDNQTIPQIPIPSGFEVRTVNYMLKGICPQCAASFKIG